MRKFVLTLIRLYQVLSGAKSPSCRYLPTCSQYTYEAIEKNGFFGGVCLGVKRLGRCHPLHKGGYDPVP